MSYNWERAPYPFERHRKAVLTVFIVLAMAVVGLQLL